MKTRQIFAILLAMCFIFLNDCSALAMGVEDLSEDIEVESELSLQPSGALAEPPTLQSEPATGAAISLQPSGALTEMPDLQVEPVTGAAISLQQIGALKELPTFQIDTVTGVAIQGLYGTLSYIPANTVIITVFYSFDGDNYYAVENKDEYSSRKWDLTGLEEGAASLTQLCIGENDSPLKAYLREAVNTLFIKLQITQMLEKGSVDTYTEAVKLSHNKTWDVPELPPDFTAKISPTEQGYLLKGKFTDFLPNTVRIRPMYSLDGENYQVICAELPYDWLLDKLGTEDEAEFKRLNNQVCAEPSVEPLKSYLAGEINSFYIKLQITLEDGSCYDTKSVRIERGMPQLIPDTATISAIFPSSMRVLDRSRRPYYTYGKYQITVRENTGKEDIYELLPDTVPVEIQIGLEGSSGTPVTGYVETAVSWRELPDINVNAGETLIIENAANSLVIPAGTQVHTPLGIYILPRELMFEGGYARDEIRLAVNVIAKNEKAEVSLRGTRVDDEVVNQLPISLAFSLKPSGATKIMAYSYIEGDSSWAMLCDLLNQRDIDANQSERLYGYVDVIQPVASSYHRYLQGEVPGILVALTIEGGVYDGETVILPWPGEYNPPPEIPKIGGSGGNENNAGNGDNNGNGSSNNGGQRPDLPKEEKPPVTPPPYATPNPTMTPNREQEPSTGITPNPTVAPDRELEPSTDVTPNPASAPDGESKATPGSAPILSQKPEPTPGFATVLKPEPTPVAPLYSELPGTTPIFQSKPTTTPTSALNTKTMQELTTTLLPEPSPMPSPELAPVSNPEAEPTQDLSLIPDADIAVPSINQTDSSTSDRGDNTSVFNNPGVGDNVVQEEVPITSFSSMPLIKQGEGEQITAQPSEHTSSVPAERTLPSKPFPKALTIGVIAVGAVAVTGVAAGTTGAAASAGVMGKLIIALKKLLFLKK